MYYFANDFDEKRKNWEFSLPNRTIVKWASKLGGFQKIRSVDSPAAAAISAIAVPLVVITDIGVSIYGCNCLNQRSHTNHLRCNRQNDSSNRRATAAQRSLLVFTT